MLLTIRRVRCAREEEAQDETVDDSGEDDDDDEDDETPGQGGVGAADGAADAALASETPPSTMPPYPDTISTAVSNQVKNILEAFQNKDRASLRNSYRTAFNGYELWHKRAYSVPAPRDPHTGFIWTDRRTTTEYLSYMAGASKSIHQMQQSRSALNYVINAFHTVQQYFPLEPGAPPHPPVAYTVTAKDPVHRRRGDL